jgi:hypothetical protein
VTAVGTETGAKVDETVPIAPDLGLIVEYYREDTSPALRHIFSVAIPLVLVGCILMAVAFVPMGLLWWERLWVSSIGFVLTVVGPVWAFYRLKGVAEEEDHLTLRVHGFVDHTGDEVRWAAWEDVEAIAVEAEGVRVDLKDGSVIVIERRLSGVDPNQLVERMKAVHRKSLWGLLGDLR